VVYCTKCGTNNTDDATVCVQCGAPLYGERVSREYGYPRRARPFMGIFIGLMIIFAGFAFLVSELYAIDVPWVPIIMILFGVFILVRLLQVRSRRR